MFGGQTVTFTAIDRLAYHATMFEMNVDSNRRKSTIKKSSLAAPHCGRHSNLHPDRRSATTLFVARQARQPKQNKRSPAQNHLS